MYPEWVADAGEPIAGRVAAAGARTVAAGTARLFAAWSEGSPVPQAADQRCEGVADFAARRARVAQAVMFTSGATAEFMAKHQDDDRYGDLHELGEPQEAIYDGANTYLRVGGNWTGFFLGDPGGPRGVNDPLWPLDALFGARDAVEIGADPVRGVSATHYRVTIDLARADAALPAGVMVPAGPYRRLSQIPAEVWLDADGLARRIAVMTDPTAGDDGTPMWSIVELQDFGVLADITPPDRGEVVSPRDAYSQADGLGAVCVPPMPDRVDFHDVLVLVDAVDDPVGPASC